MRSCIAEAIGTFGLVLVGTGATVALGAPFGGPISGVGPMLGVLLAVGGCRCVRSPECCRAVPDVF